MRGVTLIWHRHDLRLCDNALYQGLSDQYVVSVYVFEPSSFARLPSIAEPSWDVARTGPHAARVLLAAVDELRSALRARGGELLVRHGDPASILPQLALAHNADEVRWHEEAGTEELDTSARVRSALRGRRVHTEWGCTLYHPDDLPGPDEWAALAHPVSPPRLEPWSFHQRLIDQRSRPCRTSAASISQRSGRLRERASAPRAASGPGGSASPPCRA